MNIHSHSSKTRRGEATKATVLRAALELFAQRGFHGTAVPLIAKRAGVATLVLTHLLPAPRSDADKQGFIEEVRSGGFEGELIVADDLTTVRFGR